MNSPFLRRVLTVDAVVSGVAGVVMLLGAGVLGPVLALPAGLLRGAGVSLFPWFVALIWLARRTDLPRRGVQAVIAVNGLWVLGSIAVLFELQPSLLGYGFVIAQAVMVGLFAELEVVGLMRQRRAA
jgi:hypothetical protein